MRVFSAGNLFIVSLFLYLFAAVLSLVLIKKHRLCNIISNLTCMLAAVIGLISTLIHLFIDKDKIVFDVFQSVIPFISFNITIDNLSAFFILGLSILTFCVSLYSIGYLSHYYEKRSVGYFNFLYSAFVLSMALVLTSGNAVFFLISWEAMSVLSYFLVVFESENEDNQKAGIKYLVMTTIGTAFLLIAFMLMFRYTGTFNMFGSAALIPPLAKNILFVLYLVGFGIKAGVVPVHIWLPDAHPAAPSNVSALMSGIMIKTAIYGLLRFVLTYMGVQRTWWGVTLLAVGMASAVLGVAYAYVESNIKRLLAYSSIENIGIIFIGLGVGFIALAQKNPVVGSIAIAAALFHAFNHMLFKGSLFLGAGSIHYATHTKDMEELGGLIKRMPVTTLCMLGGALSISAIVPFNGFASEWLTFQSIFASIVPGQAGLNIAFILAVAALALAGALAAACFMKLFGISFLGKARSEHAAQAQEVPMVMRIGTGILVSLCLVVGLMPALFMRLADRVMLDVTGQSLIGQLTGWFTINGIETVATGNAISPLIILAVFAAVILASIAALRLVGGKYIERKYGTWDCGYHALNARMQYSSMGFSKPIKIVFRLLFRPSRQLTAAGDLQYHPESLEYTVKSESVIEKYLYEPMLSFVKNLSLKAKGSIQTGSIRRYLAYILIAILLVMLYNRVV